MVKSDVIRDLFDDKVAFFTTGKSISGASYVRFHGDGLDQVISDSTALRCEDPSLTSQSFRDESDINYIIDTYARSGELPPQAPFSVQDVTELPIDYHSALNMVRDADSNFLQLPARVRSRFDNDAGKLLSFLADPSNYEEAARLGIVTMEDLSTGDFVAPTSSKTKSTGGKSAPVASESVEPVSDGSGGKGDATRPPAQLST